jgi:hypothetical protein
MIYVDGLLRKKIDVIVMRTCNICFMINGKEMLINWNCVIKCIKIIAWNKICSLNGNVLLSGHYNAIIPVSI